MQPAVVFENDQFLVIDKPAGVIVNKALTTEGIITIQDWLKEFLQDRVLPWSLRLGVVHRLDKETCGLLVIAKTEIAYYHLLDQFKKRLVEKNYLALVHGRVQPAGGTIRLPIKRDPTDRKKYSVRVGGKMSETAYQTITGYRNPRQKNKSKRYFTLLKIIPKTGRTHQIRVHLSHIRFPIVADPAYAGRKTRQSDRGWCPHLFLQSIMLAFVGPEGKAYRSPLPLNAKLKQALEKHLEPLLCQENTPA